MGGGSSKSEPTQTTKYELSPEQRELMGLAMPGVREFAAKVPQRYQGSQVAGFDPSQTSGQEMVLGAAPGQAALASTGAGAISNMLTPEFLNPDTNPAVGGAIKAATRPIYENLTETALPAIRGEAVTTGNFGASRQGIAEGLASGRASQAAGDTGAKIAERAYSENVTAQLRAAGLLPSIQQTLTVPGTTTSAVGDVRQAMDQAQLNQEANAFNFDQYAPFLRSKEIIALLQGLPGGAVVSTANNPAPNKFASALGGAAAGASLGSALMPGVGTAAGAGIGAVLPFLLA